MMVNLREGVLVSSGLHPYGIDTVFAISRLLSPVPRFVIVAVAVATSTVRAGLPNRRVAGDDIGMGRDDDTSVFDAAFAAPGQIDAEFSNQYRISITTENE